MKLGISMTLPHSSPEEWASKHISAGLESVVFPLDYKASVTVIDQYVKAAENAGLCIAEVGAWCNPLSPDTAARDNNISFCQHQLELAEYVRANCCVNISGSTGAIWDGGYAENYSDETYDKIVTTVQKIIDYVNPVYTRYTLEPMPNMLPDSPESYLKLMDSIDRTGFGVHMDAVNLLNSPKRYFFNKDFVSHCFAVLGDKIRSCHVKDTVLENALTLSIRETECGCGGFDIMHYCNEVNRNNPDMPMIIEHLAEWNAYERAIAYIKSLQNDGAVT